MRTASKFVSGAVQKREFQTSKNVVNLFELGKHCKMSLQLQKSASIKPSMDLQELGQPTAPTNLSPPPAVKLASMATISELRMF